MEVNLSLTIKNKNKMKNSEKVKVIENKVQSNNVLCEMLREIINWYDLKNYLTSKDNKKYTMLLMSIDEENQLEQDLIYFDKRNEFIDELLVSGMDCYFDIKKGETFDYNTHIDLVHLWYNLLSSITCGERLIENYKLLNEVE